MKNLTVHQKIDRLHKILRERLVIEGEALIRERYGYKLPWELEKRAIQLTRRALNIGNQLGL